MDNWLDKKEFGMWCEDQACKWLQGQGWQILERNVHFREGEVDIIAERDGALRFVEVKGRRSRTFGGVVEALTREKVRRIRLAVFRWRQISGNRQPGKLWFLGVFVDSSQRVTIEEHLIE